MPTVIEIVAEHLQAGGFDGLANADAECGCFLDDLVPCREIGGGCRAGRKAVIDGDMVCVEAPEPDGQSVIDREIRKCTTR